MPIRRLLAGPLPALASWVFLVQVACGQVLSPIPPQDPVKPSSQVVVTASRTEQDAFDSPRSIDVVDLERLHRGNFRSLPQALRQLPSAFIQGTSPGQGSPYLRGFTGYNNLLLIDGIRVNNSTFRSGPNQYWSTIDPLSLSRIEVLRGPSSTLYGSDAVGGTVQVFTKSPDRFASSGVRYGGEVFARYATAENSPTVRSEVQVGAVHESGERTGFLLGGTARTFGDIEAGGDTGLQPNTSHRESGFDVKIEHYFDDDTRLVLLHQGYSQDDVPRTHSTNAGISWRGTSVGSDLQRDNDQDRQLSYVQLHRGNLGGVVDKMHLSMSWQTQRWVEDRIKSSGSQKVDTSTVGTLGAFAQFESDAWLGYLTYGVDYYRDNVNSSRRRSTYQLGDEIQGKVGDDSVYDLLGVYVQDRVRISDAFELEAGVRYTYAAVDADSVRDPVPVQPTRISLSNSWNELTANIRGLVHLDDGWNAYVGASQGFRAPSLTDLTSFDVARSGEQEQPATDLEEERFLGYEIGTKVRTAWFQAQAAWFYTDVEDQILRFPTGIQSLSGDDIVSKDNVGDGYIQGAELQYVMEIGAGTELFGAHSYQYGRISNYENAGTLLSNDYPSRLMPFTSMVGIRWENVEGNFHAETDVFRAEDADKLSFRDLGDTQRIPPGGTPSYTVWNVRCGWQMDKRASLELALENITDVDYRVHGSGSNSLGRNLIVGMRVMF